LLLALLLGRTEFSVLFNQQLLYPNTTRPVSDGELHGTLQLVGLPLLVERCGGFDAELDFGKLLSIGEQQRLAVARVLISAHAYVILDEATSALDADNEQRMYGLMQRTGAT
jgi:vitamin B12/bleomycin/antimicrobial peptide transport system ATP-binding/permease protein